MHFTPKANNPVLACQITESVRREFETASGMSPFGGWSIVNPSWGDERVLNGKQIYLHYGKVGDYVMKGASGPDDFYRIEKSFFDNTYEFV